MKKHPKNLDIKIGSPLEVLWTNVKKNIESTIKQTENELIINRAMLELAKAKIGEEQEIMRKL